jgi:hypothetical protein
VVVVVVVMVVGVRVRVGLTGCARYFGQDVFVDFEHVHYFTATATYSVRLTLENGLERERFLRF